MALTDTAIKQAKPASKPVRRNNTRNTHSTVQCQLRHRLKQSLA